MRTVFLVMIAFALGGFIGTWSASRVRQAPAPVAQDRVFGVKHIVEIPGSNGREWHVRLKLMEPDTTGGKK